MTTKLNSLEAKKKEEKRLKRNLRIVLFLYIMCVFTALGHDYGTREYISNKVITNFPSLNLKLGNINFFK